MERSTANGFMRPMKGFCNIGTRCPSLTYHRSKHSYIAGPFTCNDDWVPSSCDFEHPPSLIPSDEGCQAWLADLGLDWPAGEHGFQLDACRGRNEGQQAFNCCSRGAYACFLCLSYMSSLPHCSLLVHVQLALSSPGNSLWCCTLHLHFA